MLRTLREYLLTREIFFNLLVFLMWGNMLLPYMRGVVGMLPVLGNYQEETEIVMVSCMVLAALPSMLNRLAAIDWMFFAGCVVVYLLNIVFFNYNYDILVEKMFLVLCLAVPFFFFGRTLSIGDFVKPMTYISVVCVILDMLYFFIYMRNPEQMAERYAGEYYMYQAYRLLPHVLFLGWRGMKEFSIWQLLLSVLGTFLILAYGSRGPLACVGVFYIICFFAFTNFKYSFWFKSAIIALCGIGAMFLQSILLFIKEALSDLDMSTRIVERMLSGGLTHDTGRGYIKHSMYEYLNQSENFWGFGLYGSTRFGIVYPHDYVLDFFFSYGYFLGGVLLLLSTYVILKAIVVARTSMEREFIILLLCMTILKYQLSATYIEEGMYFALLGYCLTRLINRKELAVSN